MELIIRDFDKKDQDAAKGLIISGLGEHFGFIDYKMNPDVEDIWSSYVALGSRFLVAEAGGRVVGTAALKEETGTIGRIIRMSVDRSIRRKGIGKRLLGELKREAVKRGYTKLVLSTDVGWDDAIGLYGSFGFYETGRNEVDVHMEMNI